MRYFVGGAIVTYLLGQLTLSRYLSWLEARIQAEYWKHWKVLCGEKVVGILADCDLARLQLEALLDVLTLADQVENIFQAFCKAGKRASILIPIGFSLIIGLLLSFAPQTCEQLMRELKMAPLLVGYRPIAVMLIYAWFCSSVIAMVTTRGLIQNCARRRTDTLIRRFLQINDIGALSLIQSDKGQLS